MPTNTYRQGADSYAGCQDTQMQDTAATTNYGNDVDFVFKWYVAENRANTLIKFDISDIPSSATVSSATLWVKSTGVKNGTPFDSTIHQCKRSWTELGANWNVYKPGNNWQVGGCLGDLDRNPAVEDTQSVGGATVSFDITALVQKWVDETYLNQGAVVISSGDESYDVFHSSEAAVEANRPLLTVTFTDVEEEEEEFRLIGVIGSGVLPFKRAV